MIDPLLKIMGECERGRGADVHGTGAVLQDLKQDFPGIFKLGKQEIIKIFIRIRLRF